MATNQVKSYVWILFSWSRIYRQRTSCATSAFVDFFMRDSRSTLSLLNGCRFTPNLICRRLTSLYAYTGINSHMHEQGLKQGLKQELDTLCVTCTLLRRFVDELDNANLYLHWIILVFQIFFDMCYIIFYIFQQFFGAIDVPSQFRRLWMFCLSGFASILQAKNITVYKDYISAWGYLMHVILDLSLHNEHLEQQSTSS